MPGFFGSMVFQLKLKPKKEEIMGTHCLTIFKDEDGKEIAVLYRQYDGYPIGHGGELKALLAGRKLVSGFSGKDEKKRNFNGMGCLAAQVVAHFKGDKKGDKIGGFYLHAAGTRDLGEEYIYILEPNGKFSGELGEEISVKVTVSDECKHQVLETWVS
jgi:hypothetical protein